MKAASLAKKTADLARENDFPKIERDALELVGASYEAWGDAGRAAEYYEKSVEISSELTEDEHQLEVMGKLALLYKRTNQLESGR